MNENKGQATGIQACSTKATGAAPAGMRTVTWDTLAVRGIGEPSLCPSAPINPYIEFIHRSRAGISL